MRISEICTILKRGKYPLEKKTHVREISNFKKVLNLILFIKKLIAIRERVRFRITRNITQLFDGGLLWCAQVGHVSGQLDI